MAGSCECGNEPSGSVKRREFLGMPGDPLASQEGLCSMELVIYVCVCVYIYIYIAGPSGRAV